MRVVLAVIATTALMSSATASAGPRADDPSLELLSASVAVGSRAGRWGGETNLRVNFCARIGPRAVLLIRETGTHRGATRSHRTTEPLGVDLTEVGPFQCIQRFVVGWLVSERLLRRPGMYSVSVRLRDGNGRLTRSVGVEIRL